VLIFRSLIIPAIILMACLALSETALAVGMGGSGQCVARNAADVYCLNRGGCPQSGECYFPDGTYCDVWDFYYGKCPGKGYYEQMLWEAEAYRFLYSDYYPYYQPYGYQPYGYYYYNYNYNWPGYGPYGQEWLNPNVYWPYGV
jgi:hypothetical protein